MIVMLIEMTHPVRFILLMKIQTLDGFPGRFLIFRDLSRSIQLYPQISTKTEIRIGFQETQVKEPQ